MMYGAVEVLFQLKRGRVFEKICIAFGKSGALVELPVICPRDVNRQTFKFL